MYQDSKTWLANFQERMQQAKRYVKFCAGIRKYQLSEGRYFVHGHLWLAASWNLECVAALEARSDVRKVLTHMSIWDDIENWRSWLGGWPCVKANGFDDQELPHR